MTIRQDIHPPWGLENWLQPWRVRGDEGRPCLEKAGSTPSPLLLFYFITILPTQLEHRNLLTVPEL